MFNTPRPLPPLEVAREALKTLRRAAVDCDDLTGLSESRAAQVRQAVRLLDAYLTGHWPRGSAETQQVEQNAAALRAALDCGDDVDLYLTDGGYSRLVLDWGRRDHSFVFLSVSRDEVKARWALIQDEEDQG